MCPSWGGRWAGEARDKAGLVYTLMGRADAGKEEEGGVVKVCEHAHTPHTCEATATECSH